MNKGYLDFGFVSSVFFSTARIETPGQTAIERNVGTGFILSTTTGYENAHGIFQPYIYLVTNKHVIRGNERLVTIRFHERENRSDKTPKLTSGLVFDIPSPFNQLYTSHPSEDLAAVFLNPLIGQSEREGKFLYLANIPEDNILDTADLSLRPGGNVWFVGYPNGQYDTSHNLPILRRGYIASIPQVDFKGGREFLIDAHVHKGSSGSPVFSEVSGSARLVGVISKLMLKEDRKEISDYEIVIDQAIGVGRVIKSEVLRELILLAVSNSQQLHR